MCDTCGCAVTSDHVHTQSNSSEIANPTELTVLQHLLESNQHLAQHNRHHLNQHQVLTLNLMSSPGAGKTSLLEATIKHFLNNKLNTAVIEGDLATSQDAERIRRHGVPAIQITTTTACHLDANMVHNALHELELSKLNYLFIENVGNLVCPASFDLGQHRNVVLLSTPEGDDKPAKYPVMFRIADLILITKCDLLPVLDDFHPERIREQLRELANPAPVLEISSKTGLGLNLWWEWLATERTILIQR